MSRESMFALYKGDEFIDLGTRKELAARHGIKPNTITFMASPAYAKRIEGREDAYLKAYRVEEEEEE